MWLSDRRHVLALISAAALTGCGFTPVYGPGGAGSTLDRTLVIETPETSDGYAMRQRLQDRFGPPESPRYRLRVEISTREDRVAITRNQDTNRFNVIGEARYTLSVLGGAEVTSGTVDSFNSYSATGTTVATLAAERDAYRRLMTILADAIADRLLLTAPEGAS